MTTTISPSLGHGPLTQQGVGTTPGYDAIDIRRLLDGGAEGVLSSGSYAVTQRAAGANMSVDIAASTGYGARVLGDAVTDQGLYRVPPHSAVINETIAAAHATLPRNDLVILEIKDTQHDASGSNLAQTRVVTGTATAGAAQSDALGVNGTPTLPSSAIALAVVNVPATDTAITTSQVSDRRSVLGNGNLAVDGDLNAKIIRGTVSSAGAVTYGTGFTPSKTATGVYSLSWDVNFSLGLPSGSRPSVVVTPIDSVARFAVLPNSGGGTGQTVNTYTLAGAAVDCAFTFIAIGQA